MEINLDHKWKVYFYRFGIILNFFTLFGIILFVINSNLHWQEDIWKKGKNSKFNGLIEKWFFISPFIIILLVLLQYLYKFFLF